MANMADLKHLRDAYRADKARLVAAIEATGASTRGIHRTLQRLARLADDALKALWDTAGFDTSFALLAVGGFGRGELFPHSDVDVLLLMPDDQSPETNPALKARIEGFIGQCWDAGLEIGSSVRTVKDCISEASKDVTVQTSLLESRLVVGDPGLYRQFCEQLATAMSPQAFFVAKSLEMRQRHNKFENTPYALEPNCKESPGGLRDLQMILWVAESAAGYGHSWTQWPHNVLATAFEARQIKRNEALLSLIRARLHIISERREDRLVFDLQTAVAKSFGYMASAIPTAPDASAPTDKAGAASARPTFVRASEALMRRYYWAAKAVTQLNQILLLNIEERLASDAGAPPRVPQPINARFADKDGMLDVTSDYLYEREPHAILETFLLHQTTPGLRGLSARTLRALYNARGVMDSAFRSDPVNRDAFMRILRQPSGITHAMRLMNQTSVLGRYLWVFRRIVGQMQHDLFHVYTVDQHILMVLRNVRRFFIAEPRPRVPVLLTTGGRLGQAMDSLHRRTVP